jgi:hypothetical protein
LRYQVGEFVVSFYLDIRIEDTPQRSDLATRAGSDAGRASGRKTLDTLDSA